ncbi:MAG: MGMT family protein [Firmicutes bacterium]|nr:MGMT family protein [Bacillota bacterium]
MSKFKTSNLTLSWRGVETAAGEVAVAFTERGLYAVELPGFHPGRYAAVGDGDPAWVRMLTRNLRDYLTGKCVHYRCPMDDSGYPPFFQRVLRAASTIPYGEWRSYRWLALEADSPLAVRAAGQAMARNRTPLVVPCHRVLRSDGSLGGFGYGLSWKKRLLQLEDATREDL